MRIDLVESERNSRINRCRAARLDGIHTSASIWHLNDEAKILSSSCHPSVIRDYRSKLFPNDLCRSKVNRIQAAELGAR